MTQETEIQTSDVFFDKAASVQKQSGRLSPKNRPRGSQQLSIIKPVHPKITALLFITLALIAFFFTILEFFIFDIPSRVVTGQELALNIVLLSIFGGLFIFYLLIDNFPAVVNFFIFVQTAILATLMFLNQGSSTNFLVLAFPICALAAFFLPVRNSLLWIVVLFLIGGINVIYWSGFQELLSYAPAAGGFGAFGVIGALVRRSNQAYNSIESLYDELHDTHTQLTRYSEGVRQLAVSQERNRVAREMHDSLGHSLTVAVVQLEGAERLIPKDPQRAAGIIENMRGQLKAALGELRSTLAQLRSEDDNQVVGNLAMALTELKMNFMQATELDIQLLLPDHMPELSADQRHALFRACQEGLTNVQRHADASRVWVTLQPNQADISLSLADNGKGFPEQVEDGRFGLRGLRERAEFFGGSLVRRNRPQGGGELIFSIPYEIPEKG